MDAKQYVNDFIPANFFITKSMELTRNQTSGTLWFTKKFLVYYYYIFLSDNIQYNRDALTICQIFDDYIDSMPADIQGDAKRFFYSSVPYANPKSEEFKLFSDFVGRRNFSDAREEKQFYAQAKKYYFSFLMETGGQAGVKKEIREHLYAEKFQFIHIESIVRQYYQDQHFNMTQVLNDYMASLRNERQILYYYGFFHSKSNGATDEEFSSLTPIGELAMRCNFYEFIAIWEHQKFKMVSQPVSVHLDKVYLKNKHFGVEKFHLNPNPYLTILTWLDETKGFTLDEYKYLISRLHTVIDNPLNIKQLIRVYSSAQKRVQSFKRERETKDEDFRKELLKYILGLRSDLRKDAGHNPLSVCSFEDGAVSVENQTLLHEIKESYKILTQYKAERYGLLFKKCEGELRRQYACREADAEYNIDGSVKIEWDLYLMHVDVPVIMMAMILLCHSMRNIGLHEEDIVSYADAMYKNMPNIIKYCGFTSKSSRVKAISRFWNAMKSGDFSSYIQIEDEDYNSIVSRYTENSAADLKNKIEEESNRPSEYREGKRVRNIVLISALKAYNAKVYASSTPLVCECCGHTTFITSSNEMYMEYHHLIPFNGYEGPDHYLNLYALCPMCHRKMHYLPVVDKRELYSSLSANNYRHIPIEERLVVLKKEKKLRSYHLEFLLADNAINQDEYNLVEAS